MPRPMRCLLVLLLLACTVLPLRAAQLAVNVGWGGLHRIGEWTPVYVTISPDPKDTSAPAPPLPSPATLEVWAYQDARYTLVHRVPVALSAGPTTYAVPVLMGSLIEAHSVVLRADDGGVLASLPFERLAASEVQNVTTATRLVALSGLATGGVLPGDFVGAYLPLSRLPEHPELYETLDLLCLTGDTLETLSAAQSAAIVAWVKAGGRLLICIPPEGITARPDLADILPATLGPLQQFSPNLTGRQLLPKPNTTTTPDDSPVPGYAHRSGFGWVGMLSTPLTPESRPSAAHLVGTVRARVMLEPPVPSDNPPRSYAPYAVFLIVLGLLLGPAEAVIRRSHDLWPWRWWTVSGVVLLAAGAVLWLLPVSSRPSPQWVTLQDHADGQVVAASQTAVPGTGDFPRPLIATDIRGTDHKTLEVRLRDGKPVLAPQPGFAELSRFNPPGPAPSSPQWDGDHLVFTPAFATVPDEVLLEARDGIRVAVHDGTGRWRLSGTPSSTLPPDFAAARRLAPLRSASLQPRIAAGELQLVWVRSGNTYHRFMLTSPPPP